LETLSTKKSQPQKIIIICKFVQYTRNILNPLTSSLPKFSKART